MFFNKNLDKNNNNHFINVAALLVHAARIDENYSSKEAEIIKQTLIKIGAKNEDINEILEKGKKIEEDSNQILDFTKEVKNMDNKKKIEIVENLWRIVYSNNEVDIYETSLMRKLAGLLYIDDDIMGNIKTKIRKEFS
tara:strand:- start:116 stop:529 length:414 start_codon:yes stop_codon:yes gene_type:complete